MPLEYRQDEGHEQLGQVGLVTAIGMEHAKWWMSRRDTTVVTIACDRGRMASLLSKLPWVGVLRHTASAEGRAWTAFGARGSVALSVLRV